MTAGLRSDDLELVLALVDAVCVGSPEALPLLRAVSERPYAIVRLASLVPQGATLAERQTSVAEVSLFAQLAELRPAAPP